MYELLQLLFEHMCCHSESCNTVHRSVAIIVQTGELVALFTASLGDVEFMA